MITDHADADADANAMLMLVEAELKGTDSCLLESANSKRSEESTTFCYVSKNRIASSQPDRNPGFFTSFVIFVPSLSSSDSSSMLYPRKRGSSWNQTHQYNTAAITVPTPTTAYVPYQKLNSSLPSAGGKNGARSRARLSTMGRYIATFHAVKGRDRSGRAERRYSRPQVIASDVICAGYAFSSRMKE